MTRPATEKLFFDYNLAGLMTSMQAVGTSAAAQLAYGYDLGDRVTQVTYPSGRVVQYGRDTKGRVALVETRRRPRRRPGRRSPRASPTSPMRA